MAEYQITETELRENGAKHSRVVHPVAYIEVTIPEDAKECINPGTGEVYYTFNSPIAGGAILVQAYGVEAGGTRTFELQVRQKQLPQSKGGFKFVYCKLLPTEAAANAEAEIVSGAYLRSLRGWAQLDECTLIECPQPKHDGAIIIVPHGIDLPVDEETLVAQAKVSQSKWTRVIRVIRVRREKV